MTKRLSFLWFLSLLTGITLWAAPPEGGYLKVSELYDGIKVTIGNAYVPNGYMNAVYTMTDGVRGGYAEIAKQTSNISNSSSARFDVYPDTYGGVQSIWILEAADVSDVTNDAYKTNVYYLHNVFTGYYMGKCPETDDNNTIVPLATTKENAGRYQVVGQTLTIDSQNYGEQVYFRDIDNPKAANCLSCGNSYYGTPQIRGHRPNDGDNWFFIRTAPEVVIKTLNFPDLANKELYLNSNTVVSKNSDGTYHNYHVAYVKGVSNGSNYNYFNATDSVAGNNATWTFLPAGPDHTYYILNKADKVYIGKTNTTSGGQRVNFTTDKSQAGRYEVVDLRGSETAFGLCDYDNPSYGNLKLVATNDPNAKTYASSDDSSETETYNRLTGCILYNSPLAIYSGDSRLVTEEVVDYDATEAAHKLSKNEDVIYPSIIEGSTTIVNTTFLVEDPHDASVNLVAPGVELYLSPRNKFGDQGYLNIYDEMGIIVGEKAENAWMSVWNLVPDDKYDATDDSGTKLYRANDVHNNWNLQLAAIAAKWTNETDIHKLGYNLYNRALKEYISVAGGKLSLVKTQAEASEFYAVPSEDGNSVAFKTTDGSSYLTLDDSTNNLAVTSAATADSQFWLKNALNTSYSGIYDGAVVEFEPYRYDGSKLYLNKEKGLIYRSAIKNGQMCDAWGNNAGFDPGAYKAWKLIQCYESSTDEFAAKTPIADTYYIYNELAKMYLKPIVNGGGHQGIQLTTNIDEAGQYTFYPDQEHSAAVVIKDCNTTNGEKYLNVSATSTSNEFNLVTYTLTENNRLFFVNALRETPESMMDNIYDGAYIQMIPWLYKGEENQYNIGEGGYVYQRTDADGNTLTCDYDSTIDGNGTSELNTIWRIHEIPNVTDANGNELNDVYYIVNEGTGEYLCKDDDGNVVVRELPDGKTPADIGATRYQIIPDEVSGRFVVFKDVDSVDTTNNTCTYLSTDVAKTSGNDAVTTSTTKSVDTQPSGIGKDNWYYITPVDMETEIEKDLLDWIVKNLNPDNESIVGFFDAKKDAYSATYDENGLPKRDESGKIIKTPFVGPVVTYDYVTQGKVFEHDDDEYSASIENIKMPENPVERQLTFVELVALVKYYYEKQEAGTLGDEEAIEAKKAYEALINIIENEEFIVHPRIGRFYQIESAYYYYQDLPLRETYYAQYFNEAQQTQRLHLHIADFDTDPVSSFWRFDQEGKKKGTDAEHYFFIRAVNSRDVLSLTADREAVDTRADNNPEAAVYSLAKPYNLIVYPGAVVLKSHYNNDARTFVKDKSYLGMYKDPTTTFGNGIPREGSVERIEPTEFQPTLNAQNWFIKEVKEVPLYLWNAELAESGIYYYNTYCFPFKVELPAYDDADEGGLKAYIKGKADITNDGKVIELEELAVNEDGKVIVPAFQPVIIESQKGVKYPKLKIVYAEGEEYGYDYEGYAEGNGRFTKPSSAQRREADATTSDPWSMTSIDHLAPYDDEEGMDNTTIAQTRFASTGITGAITPHAIEEGEKVYVLHNNNDDTAELVVGGETFSYDASDVNTATLMQLPNESLPDNPTATYIIPCNTAVIAANDNETDPEVKVTDEDEITSGVENVTVEPVETDEAPVWYDLQGFRVVNPVAGNIYIRVTSTSTTKVLYR
jgi:hypothetical protein